MGIFFSGRDWEISQDRGKDEQSQLRTLMKNLLQCAQDLSLGLTFTFQKDTDLKHTAKTTQDLLQDKSLKVLEWPSQCPDLHPIAQLWIDLKIAVQRRAPPTGQRLRGSAENNGRNSPSTGVQSLYNLESAWV